MLERSATLGGLMRQFAGSVDHVIPKEEAVFSFGPEMRPVLEVDPGAVVTFETHDCFSGQIQTKRISSQR
jgi:acetamidase/formamidase